MIGLRLFGMPEVKGADGSLVDSVMARPKHTALLVYLAVAARGGLLSRDQLLGLFWPEHDEPKARSALRTALYGLKSDLGSYAFVTRGDDVVGVNPEAVFCDVWTFDAALDSHRFEDAVVLYHAHFLSGFFLKGSTPFSQWVEEERDRLAGGYARALERLADRAGQLGRLHDSVEWSRRLASHNPYSTNVTVRFMEALAACGDRAAALAYAERHATRLREDLDAAPSPDVVALADRLRRNPTRSPSEAER